VQIHIFSFRCRFDFLTAGSIVGWAVNRWVLKPNHIGGAFTQGYLNDVICLPLFLPIILLVQRLLKFRENDNPPRAWEIVQHAIIFSIVFEVILPRYPEHFRTTADPLDAVAYLAGGLGAWPIWHSHGVSFAIRKWLSQAAAVRALRRARLMQIG
jgi:hypothetical protein